MLSRYCFMAWLPLLPRVIGLVGRDHDARGRRYGLDEPELGQRAVVGEEPPTRAEHDRVDHEQIPVDQPAPDQALCKLAASEHDDVVARLLPEGRDGIERIALE